MLPVARVIGHKEWAPGRKSDPVYSMPGRRQQVADFVPRTSEEIDMATAQQILDKLAVLESKVDGYGRRVELIQDVVTGSLAFELDYRGHHGNPQDVSYGHVLSIRKELADLRAVVATKPTT